MTSRIIKLMDRLAAILALPGKLVSWLALAIVLLSVFSVIANQFKWHELITWQDPIFLFGTTLTTTSIMELQWHCFAVMMLFGGAYAQQENVHVRVDIIYGKLSDKMKMLVNLIGDTFLLVPFCFYVVFYSLDLVNFSFMTNEMSSEMGLTHRWVVKSVLPIGMGFLGLQAICRIISSVLRLITNDIPEMKEVSHGG